MRNKRYLVTGGCGFIGANLVRRLCGEGAFVRVIDDLSSGRGENIAGCAVEFIQGDIRDAALLERCLKDIAAVIHLAARPGVINSINDPETDFQVNALATFNLLQSARRHKIERFIFASTGGAILGDVPPPVHEEMCPRPISPYGAGKLTGEAYCSAFWGAYGLKTTALRFSNIYGPYSSHKSSVAAQFIKDILQNRDLTIYGDGRQTRDFLYADDLVSAILLAVTAEASGEVIQIASGRETSVLELAEIIKKVSGRKDIKIQFKPARKGEVSRNFARIDKARAFLKFNPVTGLETGIVRTWEYFRGGEQDARCLCSSAVL